MAWKPVFRQSNWKVSTFLLTIVSIANRINQSDRALPVTVYPILSTTLGRSNIKAITLSSHSVYCGSTYLNSHGEVFVGNILSIRKNGQINPYVEYSYDSLNQLTEEIRHDLNQRKTYTYDKAGNITGVTTAPLDVTGEDDPRITHVTNTYSSGDMGDLLTVFNGNESISYDNIGNPISYRNKQFTWSDGRKLTHAVIDSNRSLDVEYDIEDLRTEGH